MGRVGQTQFAQGRGGPGRRQRGGARGLGQRTRRSARKRAPLQRPKPPGGSRHGDQERCSDVASGSPVRAVPARLPTLHRGGGGPRPSGGIRRHRCHQINQRRRGGPVRTNHYFLAGTLVLLGLSACSGEGTEVDGAAPTGASEDSPASEELTAFAAASLQESFDDLLTQFGEEHPDVTIAPAIYDGSSTLVTQLEQGADAGVLATATEPTMAGAVAAGVLTTEPELFATNELVIAVPEDNPYGISALPDVLDLDYAICAVQVPCGDATAQLFQAAGLTADPISEEQNVTSVANRVSAGDVDAGFIYSTDVAARSELRGISPKAAQIINNYPIGATSESQIGAEFVEFVLSDQGRSVLESYGFGQP